METKQSNNSATPMADAVKIANQRALFSLEWENDTVFKKRELNYKTKAAFQKDLEAGKISKYTTVFIKDSKEIYKNGQYYGAGSSSVVDISDIIGRLNKIEGSGKVEQSDYDNLKKYISEGKILVCNSLEDSDTTTSYNVSYYFDGNNITISANIKYGTMGVLYSEYLISNDLSISKSTSITPFTGYVSECNLSEKYKKSDSYTPIKSSDSIEAAIGKLEASIGKIVTNGDGTKFLSDDGTYKDSNIYFLPEKILDLKRESTSGDFLAVFGNINNLKDVLNKSLNGKILAVKRNSTGLKYGGTQTISANVALLATAYYVSLGYFIPKTSFDTSTIFREIKFLISSESSGGKINNFSIKDIYHGGYKISANIYTLSDESTSGDISLVFTTADKLKKLILAIIDGNRILINGTPKGYEDTTNMYGEYINNVETIACKIFDNGNMILTLKIFLCAYIAVQTSILMVEYNKSENKFSYKINKI